MVIADLQGTVAPPFPPPPLLLSPQPGTSSILLNHIPLCHPALHPRPRDVWYRAPWAARLHLHLLTADGKSIQGQGDFLRVFRVRGLLWGLYFSLVHIYESAVTCFLPSLFRFNLCVLGKTQGWTERKGRKTEKKKGKLLYLRHLFRFGYSHHLALVMSLPTWPLDGFGEFTSSISRPCPASPLPQSWVAVTWQSSPRGTVSTSCAEQLGSAGRQDLSHTSSLLLLSRLKMSFSFSGCTELRMMMPSPRSRHSSPAMHDDMQ